MKKMEVDILPKNPYLKNQDPHHQDLKILIKIENHPEIHLNILEEEVKMSILQFMSKVYNQILKKIIWKKNLQNVVQLIE